MLASHLTTFARLPLIFRNKMLMKTQNTEMTVPTSGLNKKVNMSPGERIFPMSMKTSKQAEHKVMERRWCSQVDY